MTKKDTRAFPTGQDRFGGMTLRDYFAGQALMGMLARTVYNRNSMAKFSYQYADAMLKEREEENENS